MSDALLDSEIGNGADWIVGIAAPGRHASKIDAQRSERQGQMIRKKQKQNRDNIG